MSRISIALLLIGCALVTLGVGAISVPVGVIVAGCLCVTLAVAEIRGSGPSA